MGTKIKEIKFWLTALNFAKSETPCNMHCQTHGFGCTVAIEENPVERSDFKQKNNRVVCLFQWRCVQ
jgi:hypothetical protein